MSFAKFLANRTKVGRLLRAAGSRRLAKKEVARIKRGTFADRTKTILAKRGLRSIGKAVFGNKRLDYSDGFGTGILGQAVKKSGKGGGKSGGSNVYHLNQPRRVSNQSAPTLSSFNLQMNNLVELVEKIADQNQAQQTGLVAQLRQTEQANEESILEPHAALQGGEKVAGEGISPMADVFESLEKKIEELTHVIDDKIKEGNSDNDNDNNDYSRRRNKKTKVRSLEERASKYKPEELLDKNGKALHHAALESKLNKLERVGQAAKAERFLPKLVRGTASILSKIPGVGALGRGIVGLTSKAGLVAATGFGAVKSGTRALGGLIASGAKKATLAATEKVVGEAVIKKLAKPIIAKGLGKLVAKSIPFLGWGAGALFAAEKLVHGDVVGAGLEAAGSVGSAFTAVPAFALSASRDVYAAAYGIEPEVDPKAGTRMPLLAGIIGAMVTAAIAAALRPSSTPTGASNNIPKVPTPVTPSTQAGGQTPAKLPAPAQPSQSAAPAAKKPDAAPAGGGGGSGGSTEAASKGAAPAAGNSSSPASKTSSKPPISSMSTPSTPAVAASAPAAVSSNTDSDGESEKPQNTPIPPVDANPNITNGAQPEPPSANEGQAIRDASQQNDVLANGTPKIETPKNSPIIKPAVAPTSRAGAVGIGNVPDPTYGSTGHIAYQIYFRACL